jgi:hypothetical protein
VYSGSKEDAGDGAWVPVRPVKGSLTINTGDMMQVRNWAPICHRPMSIFGAAWLTA